MNPAADVGWRIIADHEEAVADASVRPSSFRRGSGFLSGQRLSFIRLVSQCWFLPRPGRVPEPPLPTEQGILLVSQHLPSPG